MAEDIGNAFFAHKKFAPFCVAFACFGNLLALDVNSEKQVRQQYYPHFSDEVNEKLSEFARVSR